jgi:hypothetical protein
MIERFKLTSFEAYSAGQRLLFFIGIAVLSLGFVVEARASSCESSRSFVGKSSITYKKAGFGSGSDPKNEDLTEGRRLAIQNAFEQFADQCLAKGQLKVYLRDKAKFLSDAESLVNVQSERSPTIDKKSRTIETMVKVGIKVNMIAAIFEDNAPAATAGSAGFMVYIFAGRQAVQTIEGSAGGGSTKSFDTKRTEISSSKSAASATEMSAQQGDTMMTAQQSEVMTKKQSGGSSVNKEDVVVGNTIVKGSRQYEMISTKGMDATFKEILTGNGFRPVPFNATKRKCGCSNPEILQEELAETGDLSANSWDMIARCLQEKCNIPFFAVGTLDANTPMQSKVKQGSWQVQAKVTGKVIDLRDFLPVDIAAFSTPYEDGFSTSDNAALEDAIKILGKATATEIVSGLNAAGVR